MVVQEEKKQMITGQKQTDTCLPFALPFGYTEFEEWEGGKWRQRKVAGYAEKEA